MSEFAHADQEPNYPTFGKGGDLEHITAEQYELALSRGVHVLSCDTSTQNPENYSFQVRFLPGSLATKLTVYLFSARNRYDPKKLIEIRSRFASNAVTELDQDKFFTNWYELIMTDQMPISEDLPVPQLPSGE